MSDAKITLNKDRALQMPPWFSPGGPQSDVVISTRIRLARNLANHRFPYRSSPMERKAIYENITSVFSEHEPSGNFTNRNFFQLERIEQLFYVEERIVSPELLRVDGDRGVISDASNRIHVMVNEEDHLRIQGIDSGFRSYEIWGLIDLVDDTIGSKLKLSFDRKYGFLTCCPTNSGTGMRVSFLMHLPGLVLTKSIDAVLQGASQLGLSTRGFFGEHSEVAGNMFQLSNQATMGAHENEFLKHTSDTITEIIGHERIARDRILNDAPNEILDKVMRSYGILLYAQTLSVPEFLNLASALRLGIECSLFKEMTIEELNRISLLVMPAHLQVYHQKIMSDAELSVARAELVRDLLKKRTRKSSSRKPHSGRAAVGLA